MSKSLMDAIRQTITEGARDKTSDGMTKDAKQFSQDLHRVSDAGFKHMVQKDSETKDYEKMFNGDVAKAPTRLADLEPGEDLDKYVEYNEEVKKKKHSKSCDCDDCNSVKEDVSQTVVGGKTNKLPMPPAPVTVAGKTDKMPTPPAPVTAVALPTDAAKASVSPATRSAQLHAAGDRARSIARSQTPKMAGGGTMSQTSQQSAASRAVSQTPKMAGGGTMGSNSAAPKPTPRPSNLTAKPQLAKPAIKSTSPKPAVAVKPVKPMGTPASRLQSKTQRDDVAGPRHLKQSYEIEWNGKSYVLGESAAKAMGTFIEKYGIEEGTAGEFIHKEMQHPEKLTANGKKQKIKQAIAIYYSKKRRGENP